MAIKYSIKDLEVLSGVKAHTLRIWEHRYHILKPQRSTTNIRLYSDDDLKFLLNISFLNTNGFKISSIATMSREEVNSKVQKISETHFVDSDQQQALLMTTLELDLPGFEKIISSSFKIKGFESTIEDILFPFLKKTGLMWQTGAINPAQEHFISNIVRQKICSAIDRQKLILKSKSRKYLLFLPEGELHELSLLYYSYIIRSQGSEVTYLGQSVPFEDLKKVIDMKQPDGLLTIFTVQSRELNIEGYIKKLSESFPEKKILVSGAQVIEKLVKIPKRVILFKTAAELLKIIK